MDKYETLGVVGEGSYGIVSKVIHKPTNRIVAIKKFIESEDDKNVRKIALREVRALKKLKHDNLVALLEVFRRKKRLYLVFEYVDRTVLDELERSPNGLSETFTCKIIYQVLLGVDYMHSLNFIHRDIKPENILISKSGVVKICDFGFARSLFRTESTSSNTSTIQTNDKNVNNNKPISAKIQCTDYVATRWYRAPELLVGDLYYGQGVDIWAIGCLTAELSNSLPLFPGKSDLDQLHLIMSSCGELCQQHQVIFEKSSTFKKFLKILPSYKIGSVPLERQLKTTSSDLIAFIKSCLKMDPNERRTCQQLLGVSGCFQRPVFQQKTLPELKNRIDRESNSKQVPLKESKAKNKIYTTSSIKTVGGRTNVVKSDSLGDKPSVKILPAPTGPSAELLYFPKLDSQQSTRTNLVKDKRTKHTTKQSKQASSVENMKRHLPLIQATVGGASSKLSQSKSLYKSQNGSLPKL